MSKFTNKLNALSQKIIATPVASSFFGLTMIVILIMTSSFNTVAEESTIPFFKNYNTEVDLYDVDSSVGIIDNNNTKSIHTLYTLPSACTPPPKDPGAVAPSSYDIDVVASGTITWSSLVGIDPEKITNKIRITGNGTVIVSNANLKLEGSGAAVVIDGPTLLVENGDIQIESSGAKFIMNNGVLRTYGNVQQKPNSIISIQDSEVEIGDESANGIFTTGNSSTSADFQNDGGYRYLNNVCINVTHDYQLQSTGSGTGLNGVDVLINVCMEVGDRGANHATPTDFGVADNDDSGNFQNSNRMFIYDTSIIIANGNFQNNSGTTTFCNLETKLNKSGNFQINDGTFRGEALSIAAEDVIENSGNWDATISSWYSDKQNTLINIPNGGPESTQESILNSHFTACCMNEECELQIELDDVVICSGESVELNPTLSGVSECVDCTGEYGVENTNNCRRDQDYVFWLTDGDNPRWFSNVDLQWNELTDGTATLTGTILDHTLTQTTYEVNAVFSGRTTNTPSNSPKEHECNDEDETGWVYYTGLTGTVTSTDGSWSIDLSRRGPAFQLGNGANVTETEQGKPGACGWFNTTDSKYNRGDFNFNLGDCVTTSTAEVSYLWSTGETTESITVLPDEDTAYSVTVTNCNGCSATDEVMVSVKSATVEAGDDQNVCLGETVTLSAAGEGTFTWSTGETTETITVTPTETTTYIVTATNGSCEASDSVTIIVNDPVVVDAGEDQEICLGKEVTLTAQASGIENCTDCAEYTIEGTDYCAGDHDFVIWMTNADRSDRRWYANVDLVWKEFTDGTATLTGTVLDYTVTQETYELDVTYSGKTTIAPTNSPKDHECNTEDATGWVYYPEMSGTITKTDGSEVITITRRGEAFQAGNGANVFETKEGKNGASGWIDVVDGYFAYGDININFGDCIAIGSGEASYLWSTGETTQSITVSPEEDTTYTVTVTGCTDCVGEDEVTVTVDSAIADAGDDQDICAGETATLMVVGEGTVLWSTGEITSTIEVSPEETTTYSVTISNGSCEATDEITVVVNSATADAGEDQTICLGESTTLSVVGEGTVLWSTGETTSTIEVSPQETTTYTVDITNGDCSAIDGITVFVNSVTANAGEDQTICLGESTTLSVVGEGTVLWSTGEITSTIEVSPEEMTTYSVTISNGSCEATDEVTVSVNSVTANAGEDQTISLGETATLTATGGDTYVWSTGATTATIEVSPIETTTYTVIVSANGCEAMDNVTVRVEGCSVIADAGEDQEICFGEEAMLTVEGEGDVLWSTGETTTSITVSPGNTTTYSVIITNGDCEAMDEVTVGVTIVEVSAGRDKFLCEGFGEEATLTASLGDSYLWSTGETTRVIVVSPNVTTNYTVTVAVGNCSDTDEVIVFVDNCDESIIASRVYPTVLKSGEKLTIDVMSKKDQIVDVSFYSMTGSNMIPVTNNIIKKGKTSLTFDMIGSIRSGMYLVRIDKEEGTEYKKFIIK